jgi:hypothetical protein
MTVSNATANEVHELESECLGDLEVECAAQGPECFNQYRQTSSSYQTDPADVMDSGLI